MGPAGCLSNFGDRGEGENNTMQSAFFRIWEEGGGEWGYGGQVLRRGDVSVLETETRWGSNSLADPN